MGALQLGHHHLLGLTERSQHGWFVAPVPCEDKSEQLLGPSEGVPFFRRTVRAGARVSGSRCFAVFRGGTGWPSSGKCTCHCSTVMCEACSRAILRGCRVFSGLEDPPCTVFLIPPWTRK